MTALGVVLTLAPSCARTSFEEGLTEGVAGRHAALPSVSGRSGSGGTRSALTGTGGQPETSGGTSSGGGAGTPSSGGTLGGGTASAGSDSGGVGAGAGGSNSGGTDAGGTDAGGTDAGGTDAGGTDAGGTNSGGTNSGGTSSGGSNSGGAHSTSDKIVFVSSALYNGNLGGLNGGDAKCQGLASAAGLQGTFRGWLSADMFPAANRLTHAVGHYVLVDGTVVANDWDGLTLHDLLHPIDQTELGTAPSPTQTFGVGACEDSPAVMTGTYSNGQTSVDRGHCANWTDAAWAYVMYGETSQTQYGNWAGNCDDNGCYVLRHIYCFEQ